MVLQSFRILSVTFSRSMVSKVSMSESKLVAPWSGAGWSESGVPRGGSTIGTGVLCEGGICDAGFMAG